MPKIPYQSTPADHRRAVLLGVVYVLLAIGLAIMLFKIWPPTPWPSDQAIQNNPELAKAFSDCECPIPSPTPASQAGASAGTGTQTGSRPAITASPTTPTATPNVTPTAIPAAAATATPLATPAIMAPATADVTTPKTQTPQGEAFFINVPIKFLGWCFRTSFDERLILLVIIAGILGSFVHGATSLADYIGNNNFNKNWTWFYLLRPAIGMALALVFYFVIRGGFLTTSGGAKDINPYGIAALAGLVGMFSKQATDKLSEVFGTLFRAAAGEGDEKRSGSLKPPDGPAPKVSEIAPKQGLIGGGEPVTMTGENFSSNVKVTFGGVEATVTAASETSVTVTTPPHPKGKVDVIITNEDKQVYGAREGFEYTDPADAAAAGATGSTGATGATGASGAGGVDAANADVETVDGCDVDIVDETPDEDLPITEGGVG